MNFPDQSAPGKNVHIALNKILVSINKMGLDTFYCWNGRHAMILSLLFALRFSKHCWWMIFIWKIPTFIGILIENLFANQNFKYNMKLLTTQITSIHMCDKQGIYRTCEF